MVKAIIRTACYVAVVLYFWSTFVAPHVITADAAAVQEIIDKAKENPEAAAVVATALKIHPQPTQAELAKVREGVNDVLLTIAARAATGDPNLLTKAEAARRSAAQEEAERLRLSKLTWSQMTLAEQYRSFLQFVNAIAAIVVFLVLAMVGFRITYRKGVRDE